MSISLRKNMEMGDRAVNACVGAALVVSGAMVLQGAIGLILVLLSIPLLLIALTGFCPGYVPFERGTRRNSTFRGPGDTKGNDKIVSAGIESLWLMPRGVHDGAFGHHTRRANS